MHVTCMPSPAFGQHQGPGSSSHAFGSPWQHQGVQGLFHCFRMNSALLSRFDLVFILLDKPDEEMDSLLSEHVLSLHARGRRGHRQQPSAAARVVYGSGSRQGSVGTFQASTSRGDGTGVLTATARRNAEVRATSLQLYGYLPCRRGEQRTK